jgi:hypothetical protein
MDTTKLKAFASKGTGPQKLVEPPPQKATGKQAAATKEAGKKGSSAPPKKGGGNQATKDDDFKEGGEGKYSALIRLLEKHAEDIGYCLDEASREALEDPHVELDEAEQKLFESGVKELDTELVQELGELAPIDMDSAYKLATHLQGEGYIEDADPDLLAGWIVRAAAVAKDLDLEDEEDEEDVEGSDLDEFDDYDYGGADED